MADEDEKSFAAERAKTGRAACKKCKNKCDTGELRIAKYAANPFSESGGKLKQWYHLDCLYEVFKKQRAGTKTIESPPDDIDGWDTLGETDRDLIMEKMQEFDKERGKKTETKSSSAAAGQPKEEFNANTKDNSFREFRRICAEISNESSYTGKTKIIHNYFQCGSNKKKFEGDLQLWIKLLCPSAVSRIYNLQSKQLVKLFSKIFKTSHSEMLKDLEQGDVSETIKKFFETSEKVEPSNKSTLTLKDVEDFLEQLSKLTLEDAQISHIQSICKKCTSNDLLVIIRLIKQDLKINSGPKHILNALSPQAYTAFQSSRDLNYVVAKFKDQISKNIIEFPSSSKNESFGIQLMCPISPMLAEACKSIERAIEKCPQGFYSEIKYDGERVQLHKRGNEFKFFSRNLKPVMEHKVKRLQQYILEAFPGANDLILDSEIIVVDTNTGDLMPFGTLGIHKKTQFQSAEVCLFIFDCVFLNGKDLTKKPMFERRQILEENIRPIKNHVQLSEYKILKSKNELGNMIGEVLTKGLEGLVLKNINGIYEPGKRHWLKVKKDYLFEGQMADSADLVVIGAWFGTGKKGGMLSIFLMSCLNTKSKKWCTVTKVHGGLDDDELNKLQDELNPLMERSDTENLPKWLNCKRTMIPDLIAKDPYKMPVWEITGAEFSKAEIHTANGISIRFPRITKKRADKSPDTATTLDELELLFKNSKDNIDLKLLTADCDNDNEQEDAVKNNLVDIDRKNYYLAKAKAIQSNSNVHDEQPDSDDGIDKKIKPTHKHQQNVSKDVNDKKSADNLEKKKFSSKDGKNEIIDKKSNKSFDNDEKLNCRSADTPTKRKSNNTDENNKHKNDPEQVDGKNLLKKAEKRNLDDDVTSGIFFDKIKTSTTTSSSGSVGKKSKINYNATDDDSKEELVNDKKIIINYEMNAKKNNNKSNNNKDAAGKSEKEKPNGGESSKKSKRKPYADDNDIKNNKNSILKYIKATNKNNSSASSSAVATTATTTKTPAASVVDDCYGDADDDYYDNNKKMKMENVKIEKLFDEKSHLNNNIFKGVSLYVTTEKFSQAFDKELRYFTQWGGKVVHKTLNCTHALHKKDYISEDMNILRRKFPPMCRHVTENWLKDCIEHGKLEPITKYPVYLKV